MNHSCSLTYTTIYLGSYLLRSKLEQTYLPSTQTDNSQIPEQRDKGHLLFFQEEEELVASGMRRKSQGWNGKTQTLHSQPISNLCAVNDQLCDLTNILDLYKSVCPAAKWQSDQIRSVAQSCPTLCDTMNCSMPGLPVHHQLPKFTQTHIHRVSDAIQPSHPLSSPSPLAPNRSQHQSLPMSQLFA